MRRATPLTQRKLEVSQRGCTIRGRIDHATSSLFAGSFRYDTSQLAGQGYADLAELGDIVPREMQDAALKKIFDINVMKFGNGEMGAANGMSADGVIVANAEAKEVWVGTTFAYAGMLMSHGMTDQAWKTTQGLYHVIYENK